MRRKSNQEKSTMKESSKKMSSKKEMSNINKMRKSTMENTKSKMKIM